MILCRWKELNDPPDSNGWRRVECERCHLVTAPTPHEFSHIKSYCFGIPEWWEFGCWLNILLDAIFINRERLVWLKARLGFKPKCGCQGRQTALDRLGLSVKTSLERYGRLLWLTGRRWLSIWTK